MGKGTRNLIPATEGGHQLTREEQKAGGRKSAEVRKQRKNLRQMLEYLAGQPTQSKSVKQLLDAYGVDGGEQTNEAGIALRIMHGALSNDHKSIAEYMDATGQRITRNINENHNIEYKPLIDLTARKKAQEKAKKRKA